MTIPVVVRYEDVEYTLFKGPLGPPKLASYFSVFCLMFGVSLPELLVILAVMLIFLGPDRLPEAARTLGKFMADLRRTSDQVKREFYNAVYQPAEEVKREVEASARNLIAFQDYADRPNNCETALKENSAAGTDPQSAESNPIPPSPTNSESKTNEP